MNSTCMICGEDLKPWKKKGLLHCSNCYFVTTDLNISDEELQRLYTGDYFHGEEYSNYSADKEIIQKNFNGHLLKLKRYISTSGTRLFEIGCAYGFFLDLAKRSFDNVTGVDISLDAAKYARETLGLDVVPGDYLSMDQVRADVFCMWDTIEHLKHPDRFVKKISSEINAGGLIALSTCDIGSLNARIRGAKWRQIHPPTHLHYFSRKALIKLFQKNNFDVVHVSHPGLFRSLDMIAYILLVVHHKRRSLYDFLKKTGVLKLSIYFNMFDTILIIGKKRV